MKTAFRALGSVVISLSLLASFSGAAFAGEKIDKFTGMLDRDECVPKLLQDQEDNWDIRLALMKATADAKAKDYIAKECAQLDHGKFSQSIFQYFAGTKLDYCETAPGPKDSCLTVTCFGYSSGTCTVADQSQLAESASSKSGSFAARVTRAWHEFIQATARSL